MKTLNILHIALSDDIVLQIVNLLRHCDDSLSEGEIIPLSRVSKSGAGSIPQAVGLDCSVRGRLALRRFAHFLLRSFLRS